MKEGRRRNSDGIIASFDYHYRYRIIGSGHPMRFCPKNMNIISLNKLTLISLECDKQIMPRVCFFSVVKGAGLGCLSPPPKLIDKWIHAFWDFLFFFFVFGRKQSTNATSALVRMDTSTMRVRAIYSYYV